MPFDQYFWSLKEFFPGDPDFSIERYSSLPYEYVLLAIKEGAKINQNRLHNYERPMALNTSVLVAQNIDHKKQKAPSYKEFCFYQPQDNQDLPDYVFGSAFMMLIKENRLPVWALAFYKQLSTSANSEYEPVDVALIAEDAILLHPTKVGPSSYSGLLLAQESASERVRAFFNDQGQVIMLRCPHVGTKIIAEEDAILSP